MKRGELVRAYEGKENNVVVLMREKSVFNPNTVRYVPVIELSILLRTWINEVNIAGDIFDLIEDIKVYGKKSGKWYILIEDGEHIDLSLMLLGFRKTDINGQMGMAL